MPVLIEAKYWRAVHQPAVLGQQAPLYRTNLGRCRTRRAR